MLFALDWLASYVDLPPDVERICRRLTAAGFNVEGRSGSAAEVVLDLEVTTNRSDCMSHVGLARELAVIFDAELRPPPIGPVAAAGLAALPIAIDDLADCPRYAARLVRGVTVGPSPPWLVRRLESIGQRAINNVVDVTNFVLWEYGQPLHGFDLARLAGPRIQVRRALEGERLVTLDGEERRLDPEILVIADADGAVALAGVMGGRATEVSAATREILIESAHFEPRRVRRAAGKLGLQTDASHRFERGTDPELCLVAATRAAEIIVEVAGGEVAADAADVRDESADWRLHGALDGDRLDGFAGVEIPAGRVESILAGLGYSPRRVAPRVWQVRVPSWRYYDCEARRSEDPPTVWEADLYEEVMRHVGFDAIPSDLPAIGAPDEGSSAPHRLREAIRGRLSACGLAEAINYGFYDAAADGSVAPLVGGAAVALSNPLSEKYALMRRSLLPGLVASALYNQRRGADAVRLFEIGHVFESGGPEVETVALACGGRAGGAWDRGREWDLFALKGVLAELFRATGRRPGFRAASLPGLLEGTAARLVDGEAALGVLGRLDNDELTFPLYVAEVSTAALAPSGGVAVRAPSRYPAIQADATLTHAVGVTWEEIAGVIADAGVEDLAEVRLKDRYCGEGVPRGAVNTSISFRYNAEDRSLTQEEVNERHLHLVRELERRFGWRPASDG